MDQIMVTVTGVHDDVPDAATVKLDCLTDDDASDFVVVEVDAVQYGWMADALASGTDVKISVTPGQIIQRGESATSQAKQASADFRKAAEQAVAGLTRLDETDAKILEQIQVVARAVAQHDAALAPPTRKPDSDLFPIAQQRRGAEAELNRLLMNRINGLASKIRGSGIYD